jgi:hypothetical protein
MNQIKSPTIYLQVTVAALLYNLLHILAWELPLAVRLGWRINVIGDVFIISISIISIILIFLRKKIGLILGMIPALWAILFQWFLVYIISGYREPNGVWWYPLFPIFQGIMIVYFINLASRDEGGQPDQGIGLVLKSPSIYLYASAAFLLVQTGQKFVRELVVGDLHLNHHPNMVLLQLFQLTLTLANCCSLFQNLLLSKSGQFLVAFLKQA